MSNSSSETPLAQLKRVPSLISGSPLSGSLCALVTPFDESPAQRFNAQLFEILAVQQREGGSSALVPCGTTGESPTIDGDFCYFFRCKFDFEGDKIKRALLF
jgi:hypothetical protein